MAMGVEAVLETLRHNLEAGSGLDVQVGRQHPSGDGLLVFPYRLSFPAELQRMPAAGQGQEHTQALRVDLLLLPAGADGIAHLDRGLKTLQDQPVMTDGTVSFRVLPDDLDTETLTRIFRSANIDLTLSAAYRVEWSA